MQHIKLATIQLIIPKNNNIKVITLATCLCTIIVIPKALAPLPNIYYGIVSLLCAYIVLIAIYKKDNIVYFNFLKKLLSNIGDISYSLYLEHVPIWLIAKEIITKYNIKLSATEYTILALIVSIFFAWLSHKYIERKFMPIYKMDLNK